MLHDGDDDLRVVLVAIGEERADRAVDQAGNQRFLFARTALALEIAARDLAGGIGLFLVVDGQRKEVEARLRLLHRNHGGEHHGLAVGGEHGAVGLARDLAGFEDERTAAPFDFHFVVIEHVLSFICGKDRAELFRRGTLPLGFSSGWPARRDVCAGKPWPFTFGSCVRRCRHRLGRSSRTSHGQDSWRLDQAAPLRQEPPAILPHDWSMGGSVPTPSACGTGRTNDGSVRMRNRRAPVRMPADRS